MLILTRTTTLKCLNGKIEEMKEIANELGLYIKIIIKSSTNWIFHIDVELTIIIKGDEKTEIEFDKLIN